MALFLSTAAVVVRNMGEEERRMRQLEKGRFYSPSSSARSFGSPDALSRPAAMEETLLKRAYKKGDYLYLMAA